MTRSPQMNLRLAPAVGRGSGGYTEALIRQLAGFLILLPFDGLVVAVSIQRDWWLSKPIFGELAQSARYQHLIHRPPWQK